MKANRTDHHVSKQVRDGINRVERHVGTENLRGEILRAVEILGLGRDDERLSDVSQEVIETAAHGEMLEEAMRVAERNRVTLCAGSMWVATAAEVRSRRGDAEMLPKMNCHILVGGVLPHSNGIDKVHVIAGYPYSMPCDDARHEAGDLKA